MNGTWAQGGVKPLVKPGLEFMGAKAVTDDYMVGGRNVASIVNGKLFVFDPSNFDPSAVAGIPGLQVASPQETASILDPDSPENSQGGSDLSNILTGVGFIGGGSALAGMLGAPGMTAMQSAGNALGFGGGGSLPMVDDYSGGFGDYQPPTDAPWGANPRSTFGMTRPGDAVFDVHGNPIDTGGTPDWLKNGPNGPFGMTRPGDAVYDVNGSPINTGGFNESGFMSKPGFMDGVNSMMRGVSGFGNPASLVSGAASLGGASGLFGGNGSNGGGGLFNADGSLNMGSVLGGLGGAALGAMNGSKPAGVTTTVQDIPDWLKPYATSVLDQGQGIVNANKNPDFSQSDSVLSGIMGGDSIQAPSFNPYGGMTTPQTSNPYIGQTSTPGTNMHLGMDNPYFESVLSKSLNDTQGRVNNQFGNRAFGGSANQELLQRGLADQSNAARFGEYDKQTALSESDVARRLQAQQTDLARNSTLQQNQGQFNAGLYANDATRNAGIWNTDASRNQNAFQFGRNQMYNAAQGAPGYNAAKTGAAFAPLTAQKGLFTSGSQTSSPYFNNPAGGALYGGLLGSQLFGGK